MFIVARETAHKVTTESLGRRPLEANTFHSVELSIQSCWGNSITCK